MSRNSLLLLLALSALTPSVAPAQRAAPQRRNDGFWFGAGLGPAWLRVSCSICSSDRGTAFSGYVALGGSAGRRTLVGAEATGRYKRDGDIKETNWSVNAVAFWYPSARRKLYWKLGAGVQLYRLEDGTDVLTASPFGVQAGIGWELPLSRRLRWTPSATLHVASWGGALKFNGASSVSDIALTMVQVGVGVTSR